jgi:flagellin-like hook-associated protein FlgL
VSEIEYTALANEKPFRDVLVALSYFKNENLPPVADQVEIDPGTGLPVILTQGAPGADMDEMKENFYAVFNDLTKTVNRALDDIDQVRFRLENARARITELKQSHQEQKSLLLGTISNVEDVDINEVALKLNMLQIQLDASYRVTARVSQLSLVNFI